MIRKQPTDTQFPLDTSLNPAKFINGYFVRFSILAGLTVIAMGIVTAMPKFSDEWTFFGAICVGLFIGVLIFYNPKWIDFLASNDAILKKQRTYELDRFVRRRIFNVRQGCVYIIQDVDVTGYFKIGKTTSPFNRITHFDTMLPFNVELIHFIHSKNCDALEATLHRRFADQRVRGEWFNLSQQDIEWLLQMDAG